jgi:hypothetical protein
MASPCLRLRCMVACAWSTFEAQKNPKQGGAGISTFCILQGLVVALIGFGLYWFSLHQ